MNPEDIHPAHAEGVQNHSDGGYVTSCACGYQSAHADSDEAEREWAEQCSPVRVAKRIARLGASIRTRERILGSYAPNFATGHCPPDPALMAEILDRCRAGLAERIDQIAYWEAVRAAQIATGQAPDRSRDTIRSRSEA